jgi:hypothetical protein
LGTPHWLSAGTLLAATFICIVLQPSSSKEGAFILKAQGSLGKLITLGIYREFNIFGIL